MPWTALRATATSYRWFQLTLVENQWPVTYAFDDGTTHLSGRRCVSPSGWFRGESGESRVVFFAGTPGASPISPQLSHALGGISSRRSSTAETRIIVARC